MNIIKDQDWERLSNCSNWVATSIEYDRHSRQQICLQTGSIESPLGNLAESFGQHPSVIAMQGGYLKG